MDLQEGTSGLPRNHSSTILTNASAEHTDPREYTTPQAENIGRVHQIMESIEALLSSYPRQRPPLSPAHESHYLAEYRINRTGSSPITALVVKAESWMHRKIGERQSAGTILELGAGTLNHIPHEHGFHAYDFVEPFRALWENSPLLPLTRAHYQDISDVPPQDRYDRIISAAVLEHLQHLPQTIARAALLLDSSGILQAGIPSEGGLLWALAWRCVTAPAYRLRTGLRYADLMRHEHLSTATEILTVVRHFFNSVRLSWFPLPHLHFSFYIYFEADNPRRDLCQQYLARISRSE